MKKQGGRQERIAVQRLLHDQREALHTFAHVGVTLGDPYPRTRWDHRSAFSAAVASAGDADAKMVMRRSRGGSMTMAAPEPDSAASPPLITTASANPGPCPPVGAGGPAAASLLRHVYSCPVEISCRRATSVGQAPGAKASVRIWSRCSSLQRRRRSGSENTVIWPNYRACVRSDEHF